MVPDGYRPTEGEVEQWFGANISGFGPYPTCYYLRFVGLNGPVAGDGLGRLVHCGRGGIGG